MNKKMNNQKYWRKRFEKNQENLLKPTDEFIVELESIFLTTEKEIEKEIRAWYQRFADNNGIVDIAEARQRLGSDELKELKWSIGEYVKRGKENGINADWNKELENASARYHINRLEALKLNCRGCIENLYNSYYNGTRILLENAYRDSLYKSAYTIFKGLGIGTNINAVDDKLLEKIISKPWAADGKNFSQRIWQDQRGKLVNTLHRTLSRGILTGETPDKIINEVAKTMKTSRANASRLVLTESAYFISQGEKECYDKFGIEKYEVLGTLDDTTCGYCGELDGEVFDKKNFEIGVSAPPFHCNCRCTTVPYFDEFTEGERRAARGEDGKTNFVEDMTYREWKEKYVVKRIENSDESGIIKSRESNIMSLEYQRYGRNKNTVINKTYINSGEYRNKFDKITNNKEVNRILYLKAKEMLEHRSGTLIEDMYWIDSNTGKIIAKVIDETREKGIVYNNSVIKAIRNEKNITTLHTHPNSMPPSISDFNSAVRNGYRQGLVICHNGKVFLYTANEEINERLYAFYIDDFICEGASEYEAQIKALNKLKENYDINFKEVE